MKIMEEIDALQRYMNYCRALLHSPPDELLGESIKRLLARVEVKDEALRECVNLLDQYPEKLYWPRTELIAECKRALEK